MNLCETLIPMGVLGVHQGPSLPVYHDCDLHTTGLHIYMSTCLHVYLSSKLTYRAGDVRYSWTHLDPATGWRHKGQIAAPPVTVPAWPDELGGGVGLRYTRLPWCTPLSIAWQRACMELPSAPIWLAVDEARSTQATPTPCPCLRREGDQHGLLTANLVAHLLGPSLLHQSSYTTWCLYTRLCSIRS